MVAQPGACRRYAYRVRLCGGVAVCDGGEKRGQKLWGCWALVTFVWRDTVCVAQRRKTWIMKVLRDRILKDGKCYPDGILKMDKFINHQMDPNLMKQVAVEFARRYANTEINKILTIEASGIAPAIMLGFLLDLPVVFAKKKKPSTMDNMLSVTVTSFTKRRDYTVVISKDYLGADDKVLFVDDFLAYGNAAKGIIELCRQAGAQLVGMGFIIEKAFQHGRDVIERAGVRCESLAIVDSLDNCQIKLRK